MSHKYQWTVTSNYHYDATLTQGLLKGEKAGIDRMKSCVRFFLENSGTAVTRDRLMERVWGFAFTGETRTVDMHIKTLRKKLGEAGKLIETVRNVGYRIGR